MAIANNERFFFTLRDLEIDLKNTTGENRLNGLTIMNIHTDLLINIYRRNNK